MAPKTSRVRDSSGRHHQTDRRKRNASSADERRRSRKAQGLSAAALAELNSANASSSNNTNNDSFAQEQREAARRERRRREAQRRKETRRDESTRRESTRYQALTRDNSRIRGEDVERRQKRKRQRAYLSQDDGRNDDGYERVMAGGNGDRRHQRRRDRRIPSGAILEEGRSRGRTGGYLRGGVDASRSSNDSIEKAKQEKLYYTESGASRWQKLKKNVWFWAAVVAAIVVIIIIIAAVVASRKKSSTKESTTKTVSDVPSGAPSYLDPNVWVSTTDFNLTYTNETVGGLPIIGLNSTWDDSASANNDTAPLDESWGSYETTPARGVNLGGWLSLEPFITPSLFNYDTALGIIDEYTLCSYLGSSCESKLEAHYASFVTESTFQEIADAGLDHVRIPYSYWAVAVYDDDPYVFRTSWRYLLRGIEWARRYGLRVNLDLHALPGSQNGWNHSGRQGLIRWMNGTDGALNVQRSLDIHDQLSQFFAQERYANVLSHYGLANEPRMTFLSVSEVMNWTQTAAKTVRENGLNNNTVIVFGDGFCGLDKWQGQSNDYNLALDVHQYEIFNNEQIVYTHENKIEYACSDWTEQTEESMDTSTGFGPTMIAEWSQADTDCANYLGNVGNGNRWTGTYDVGNASLNALTPMCPTQNASCSCTNANADVSTYSDEYKSFLLTFAEAQMYSFEKGWGWWYWTWDTESAPQWSYKKGMAAGILPAKASERTFQCDLDDIPDFSALAETY